MMDTRKRSANMNDAKKSFVTNPTDNHISKTYLN